MDVYTDCVGIQLYTGNFITPQTGKGGVQYDRRHAFCLETQYFPNAVNEKNFKSPVLKAGDTYRSVTKVLLRTGKIKQIIRNKEKWILSRKTVVRSTFSSEKSDT